MADDDQYCLKWNNHQSTLLSVLTNLMDSERLADCILFTEGKIIKAHQVVLSACSPYLEKLLNDCRMVPGGIMPILIFSDLTFDELSSMKEYMYRGEVNIRQENLESFLKAATSLQIKGLTDGGGGDEGGGGQKRKPEPAPDPGRRRKRRESRESDAASHEEEPPKIQKKQQIFSSKIEPFDPQKNGQSVKIEPVVMDTQSLHHVQAAAPPPMVMKPEPAEPEPETHDLTGVDDDEYDDYEMPGPSQSDLSQDMSNWQMDNSMNSEDFSASQSVMNTSQPGQSSQGLESEMMLLSDSALLQTNAWDDLEYTVPLSSSNMLGSHDDDNSKYFCFCGQGFNNVDHLADHRLTSCGVTYRCKFCPFNTKNECYFVKHLEVTHKDRLEEIIKDANFGKFPSETECGCGYSTDCRRLMTTHRRECSTVLLCAYCNFASKLSSDICSHIARKHFSKFLHIVKPDVAFDNLTESLVVQLEKYIECKNSRKSMYSILKEQKIKETKQDKESDSSIYFNKVCQNAFPVSRFGDLPIRTMSITIDSEINDSSTVDDNDQPDEYDCSKSNDFDWSKRKSNGKVNKSFKGNKISTNIPSRKGPQKFPGFKSHVSHKQNAKLLFFSKYYF